MIAMKTCVTALAIGLSLATPSAVFAHDGSLEDQMACTPDVYRLCASHIPDEDAIVAGLGRNRVASAQPAVKVDVGTAARAERLVLGPRWLAADRAGSWRRRGAGLLIGGGHSWPALQAAWAGNPSPTSRLSVS